MNKIVLALTTATLLALTACGGEKQVEVNQPAQPQVEQAAPAVENTAEQVAQEQAPVQEQAPAQEPAAAPEQAAPAKSSKK